MFTPKRGTRTTHRFFGTRLGWPSCPAGPGRPSCPIKVIRFSKFKEPFEKVKKIVQVKKQQLAARHPECSLCFSLFVYISHCLKIVITLSTYRYAYPPSIPQLVRLLDHWLRELTLVRLYYFGGLPPIVKLSIVMSCSCCK